MRNSSNLLFVLLCIVGTYSSPVYATCNRTWNTSLTKIKGTIVSKAYDSKPKMMGDKGLHLKVRDNSGKLFIVHVFPTRCSKGKEFGDFREGNKGKGDKIVVLGSKFLTGKTKTDLNICAAEISSHGFTKGEKGLLRNLDTGEMNQQFCRSCEEECKTKKNFGRCMKGCDNGGTKQRKGGPKGPMRKGW